MRTKTHTEGEKRQAILCRYHMHGACRNGSSCEFSHNLDLKDGGKQNMVCTHYLKGSCAYGDKCRYDHVRPDHVKRDDKQQQSRYQPPPVPKPATDSLNTVAPISQLRMGGALAGGYAAALAASSKPVVIQPQQDQPPSREQEQEDAKTNSSDASSFDFPSSAADQARSRSPIPIDLPLDPFGSGEGDDSTEYDARIAALSLDDGDNTIGSGGLLGRSLTESLLPNPGSWVGSVEATVSAGHYFPEGNSNGTNSSYTRSYHTETIGILGSSFGAISGVDDYYGGNSSALHTGSYGGRSFIDNAANAIGNGHGSVANLASLNGSFGAGGGFSDHDYPGGSSYEAAEAVPVPAWHVPSATAAEATTEEPTSAGAWQQQEHYHSDGYNQYGSDHSTGLDGSRALCQEYYATGICSEAAEGGNGCAMVHGDWCDYCERYALHPTDEGLRIEHVDACRARHERLAARARSAEVECGICLERVLAKYNPAERKFGLLSCEHAFCLNCIRNWRQNYTGGADVDSALRTCPVCRTTTHFITPSTIWPSTEEEKETIIAGYKAKLGSIDCRHFNFGEGQCPFNTSCMYRHVYPDGSVEKASLRKVAADEGEVRVVQPVRLSDFIVIQQGRVGRRRR